MDQCRRQPPCRVRQPRAGQLQLRSQGRQPGRRLVLAEAVDAVLHWTAALVDTTGLAALSRRVLRSPAHRARLSETEASATSAAGGAAYAAAAATKRTRR